jgi:VWFA-related protein
MTTRLAIIVIAAAAAASAPQTPAFSSRAEAVRVDVLVTHGNRPVLGLRTEDFELRDNGLVQQVASVSYDEIPLNVVLALDASASLDTDQQRHLRSAGRTVLNGLAARDRAALIVFNEGIAQPAPLTSDFARVATALDDVEPDGLTSLVDASFAGMMIGEDDVGRSLMLLFSDGVDTGSWLSPASVLDVAKRSDVVVYGVEIGKRRSSFPKDLSSATGGRSIELSSTRDLDGTFKAILDEFRVRYLLSYSPTGVARGGWHRVDVRVKGRTVSVRARPGYQSEK